MTDEMTGHGAVQNAAVKIYGRDGRWCGPSGTYLKERTVRRYVGRRRAVAVRVILKD